ncbi:MAG: MarR family transcriptional regulator [Bacteroidia bacterium]|nr:MarR family transcriptional regulator [Bacteroidia bacterium]
MGRIEDEILQSKFEDEHQKVVINVLFTASWLDVKNIQRLKPFGISPQQFNVLRILRGSFPNALRLGDISDRMIDKNSNATRLVEKLRQKNLVKREVCGHSRRQVDIWITQEGLAILERIDVSMKVWKNEFKDISGAELKQLNLLLDKLRG